MKISKKITEDIVKVMGIKAEMIPLLPRLNDSLNPWTRQLPGILRGLKLKSNQVVLDLPCGKGGVSIPLAQKFGVKVLGFDAIEAYVDIAGSYADSKNVGHLCTFKAADIRNVVRHKNICDTLLWIAAPHIWKTATETIGMLRNCVTNGGKILIADAYCYEPTKQYEDYETLDVINEQYSVFGDKIIKLVDYGGALWKEDFCRSKKAARSALVKEKNIGNRRIIERHLANLDKGEQTDAKSLGLAIWVVQVSK